MQIVFEFSLINFFIMQLLVIVFGFFYDNLGKCYIKKMNK